MVVMVIKWIEDDQIKAPLSWSLNEFLGTSVFNDLHFLPKCTQGTSDHSSLAAIDIHNRNARWCGISLRTSIPSQFGLGFCDPQFFRKNTGKAEVNCWNVAHLFGHTKHIIRERKHTGVNLGSDGHGASFWRENCLFSHYISR